MLLEDDFDVFLTFITNHLVEIENILRGDEE